MNRRVTYVAFGASKKKSGILFSLADPVSDKGACVCRGEIIYAGGELHILSEDFVHRRVNWILRRGGAPKEYAGIAISQSEVPVDGCDYQDRVNYREFSIKSAYSLPRTVGGEE